MAKANPAATAFDPTKVEVVKSLTNTFKWEEEKSYYFRITGPMEISKRSFSDSDDAPAKKGAAKQRREPPMMLPVLDLTTGKSFEVIASAVVKSTLEREYPGDKYVGKAFHFVQHAKAENKNYRRYTVEEINV